MIKSVMFRLGEEYFSIPIFKVLSIEKMESVTGVVRMPSYIKGMINLRDEVVSVIDLRTFLNKEDSIDEEINRFVIVEIEDRKIAFIVDEVINIIDIEEDTVEHLIDTDVFEVAKHEDKLVIMLEIDKLLEEEKVIDQLENIEKNNKNK